MPTAIFKDLCADAADPARLAAFWGAALGLTVEATADGDAVLRSSDGAARIWVNAVAEPKVVKNRVHLDLHVPADDAVLAIGATVLADHGNFRVLADPEGNEFCAFPTTDESVTAFALCTDSADPAPIAAWWAGVTGATVGPGPDGTPRYLHGVAGLADVVWKFVPVDDPRTVKNRWHWDVLAEVTDLVAAGATVVRERDGEIGWTVLADPDGNEFCAFTP